VRACVRACVRDAGSMCMIIGMLMERGKRTSLNKIVRTYVCIPRRVAGRLHGAGTRMLPMTLINGSPMHDRSTRRPEKGPNFAPACRHLKDHAWRGGHRAPGHGTPCTYYSCPPTKLNQPTTQRRPKRAGPMHRTKTGKTPQKPPQTPPRPQKWCKRRGTSRHDFVGQKKRVPHSSRAPWTARSRLRAALRMRLRGEGCEHRGDGGIRTPEGKSHSIVRLLNGNAESCRPCCITTAIDGLVHYKHDETVWNQEFDA